MFTTSSLNTFMSRMRSYRRRKESEIIQMIWWKCSRTAKKSLYTGSQSFCRWSKSYFREKRSTWRFPFLFRGCRNLSIKKKISIIQMSIWQILWFWTPRATPSRAVRNSSPLSSKNRTWSRKTKSAQKGMSRSMKAGSKKGVEMERREKSMIFTIQRKRWRWKRKTRKKRNAPRMSNTSRNAGEL